MKISASLKEWEKIAFFLHKLAAREALRTKKDCQAALKLGNKVARGILAQRKEWQEKEDSRKIYHKWRRESLEAYIYKQGKTPEEIAEIEGVTVEKVEKALIRLKLVEPPRKRAHAKRLSKKKKKKKRGRPKSR